GRPIGVSEKMVDILVERLEETNVSVRDSCGKSESRGDPTGAKAPRRLPDRPRKASAWSGDLIFTPTQKNCRQDEFYFLKTKLIGAIVREPCGKSVPKGTQRYKDCPTFQSF
ncbi:hypothetical protein ABKP09_18375, partial [Peribacillus frigoritolerans]|uniref:hypothetical protein n=1 Tax=Peribacillus frigoritolerans TaxID=450367 RepID=UPI0032B3B87B